MKFDTQRLSRFQEYRLQHAQKFISPQMIASAESETRVYTIGKSV